jgi:hypothetical protein
MAKIKNDSLLPPEYRALLNQFEAAEREKIDYIFQKALLAVRELAIPDLWEQPELAITYWILLLSGVNQEEEMEIAKILLVWKAFIAKDSAQVLCIPHSDRESFKCCSAVFGAVKTPTLVLSNTRDMEDAILIDPQLLFTLAAQKGGLQRFLTEIHSCIENGASLEDMDRQLRTERFWAGMKLVYSEIKGLISIKIG